MAFNVHDLKIWDNLFETIPEENWRNAPPSRAMVACLDFFIEKNVQTVLDIGCGIGRWAVYLAKHGLHVKGTDFSANALRIARKWAFDEGLKVEFSCRALTELAYPGEKFQSVVAALVLDNVSRTEMLAGINQMRESLVDDGYLFALFNPMTTKETIEAERECVNPTSGITRIDYTDSEIISAFNGFEHP